MTSLVLLAGPGTGKTRTLVTRIAYRVRAGYVLPERVLAITFTRAATEEVRTRLAQLAVRGVDVRTLDSLAWKIVRENWAALGFEAEPNLLASEAEQLKLLAAVCPAAFLKGELAELNKLKNRCERLEQECHRAYQDELAKLNRIDFADGKRLASEFLRSRGGLRYVDALDEVYVDEFQDLSPLQVRLVDAIAAKSHVTIVGDPRQAIYEWNGASPDELIARRASADEAFDLVDNFRSTKPILDLANGVIAKVLPQLPGVQPASKAPGPPVALHPSGDEDEMLEHVATLAKAWLESGIPDDEVAVLAYSNATAARVVAVLGKHGVASHAPGMTKLASTDVFRLVKQFAATESQADEESPVDLLDRLRNQPQVIKLLDAPTDAAAENRDDWERLRAAVLEHQKSGVGAIREALVGISKSDEGPVSNTGVTVTTMTRSKGMEWTAVAVTDLGAKAMGDKFGEEEKCRLVYVATTRARRHLDLSWTGKITKWLA